MTFQSLPWGGVAVVYRHFYMLTADAAGYTNNISSYYMLKCV